MRIRKAVITAAGPDQRALPLQTLIDRDGREKTVLQILIEQSQAAKVEEVCVVVSPGDEDRYAQAAALHGGAVRFIAQPQPRGYAHAIWCAREFTAAEPFLHMVSDHLYVSGGRSPAERVMEVAAAEKCSVSGVQATRESQLPMFGAVSGHRMEGHSGLYRIDTVIEKPTPTEAEQSLAAPGLRAGYYLCFFGIHVFAPAAMELLKRTFHDSPDTKVSFSSVLAELAKREQYLAVEAAGRRYNLGARYGLLVSQLALALDGHDRDEVLTRIVELLADRAGAAGQAS